MLKIDGKCVLVLLPSSNSVGEYLRFCVIFHDVFRYTLIVMIRKKTNIITCNMYTHILYENRY